MTNANAHSVAPPYQLIRGDTYNLTLGVVIAGLLAACKVRAPAASACAPHIHIHEVDMHMHMHMHRHRHMHMHMHMH